MSTMDQAIVAAAARWHAASLDDEMDWDGFTLWLEADPRHRQAYEEVALADAITLEHGADLDAAFADQSEAAPESAPGAVHAHPVPLPANDEDIRPLAPHRRGWLRWGGAAIAASLVALLALPQLTAPDPSVYATGGTSREVTLADGSTVLVAPHSRLTIEGRSEDRLALEGGGLFSIRHRPERSMTITAGDVSISDIGTVFDVQASQGSVRVAVAEGRVEVDADRLAQPVQLAAGRGFVLDSNAGTSAAYDVRREDIGGWRQGRLFYEDAPLALVVADLRRYAGVMVEVPAALRDRRFSGTLIVDNGDRTLQDLAGLMGLGLVGRHGDWRLEQPAGTGAGAGAR